MAESEEVEFREWHCSSCGRFLALEAILGGAIRVKCVKCKNWNTLDIFPNSVVESATEGQEGQKATVS